MLLQGVFGPKEQDPGPQFLAVHGLRNFGKGQLFLAAQDQNVAIGQFQLRDGVVNNV